MRTAGRRIVMKIVVIGGSGLIGTKVVKTLRERGHEALAASPASGVNSITGEGLAQAIAGAQVVVDVTNAPSWEDAAVLAFFETSTRRPILDRTRLKGLSLATRSAFRGWILSVSALSAIGVASAQSEPDAPAK